MITSLLYRAENTELHLGDAVQVMASLPEESVDFIFADPPYFLSNGGLSVKSGKQVIVDKGKWDRSQGIDDDFAFHLAWLTEAKRLLTPNGTIAVSGSYHSIFQCGYALQKLGFRILNDIVWFKPNGAPNLSGRSFTASHETVIWASKSMRSRHVFNYEAMRDGEFKSDTLKNPGKQMRSVWSVATTPAREKLLGKHPTQKPLALLERLVLACSNEGDLVLDPFVGSGTTGVAAKVHGRRFIGIDNSEEYLALAFRRMGE